MKLNLQHGMELIIASVLSFVAGIVASLLSRRSAIEQLINEKTREIVRVLESDRDFWRSKYFEADRRIKQLEAEVSDLRFEIRLLKERYGLAE